MGKNKSGLITDSAEAWMVSIPFADVSELRREVGNALWLLIGFTGLVTKEFVCSGVRVGQVLGGAKLSDQFLADRFSNSFPALTIRTWRRRLLRVGLILQRRIPAGLQIAVVGCNKFNAAPSVDAPKWMVDQVSEMLGATDLDRSIKTTQSSRFKRPSQVALNDSDRSFQLRIKGDSKRDTPSIPHGGVAEGFNRFWESYPRKVAKGKARQVFLRLRPDDNLLSKMLSTIEAWKQSDDWKRDRGRYIPHPAAWLRAERWDDEARKSIKEINDETVQSFIRRKAQETTVENGWL